MKKTILTLLILILTFFNSIAQTAGDLDITFSTDGKLTTAAGSGNDGGNSVAIQKDGKIVVAGFSGNFQKTDFAILRYTSKGELDNTFSGDGIELTDIGSNNDVGKALAIQLDGKIVVAGYYSNGKNLDFAIVRYNSDGTLDNTFSGDGIQTTDIGSGDDQGYSVAIQSDGKIVVAGSAMVNSKLLFALVRLNSDGTLDNTFSDDGKQTTAISNQIDNGFSVAIQPDGKIVLAGSSNTGTKNDFAVLRYKSDGSLDNTFSGDGKQTTAIGVGGDIGNSVLIQMDGKIVVAGSSGDDYALVRYNTDGTLDNTFSGDGKQTTEIGSGVDYGSSVAIQTDGKLLVAGYSHNGTKLLFSLVRYNSDGSVDNSFSGDGKQTTDLGGTGNYGRSVCIQTDGKIIVAGTANSRIGVARYVGGVGAGIKSQIFIPKSRFNIFPNPTNGAFTVEIEQNLQNEKLTIYNKLGELVYNETLNGVLIKRNIDLSRLSKGIYFIRFAGETKRIIIN